MQDSAERPDRPDRADTAMKLFLATMDMITTSEMLARDIVDGLVVSTCATTDMGCETAILMKWVLIRWPATTPGAMVGHAWWCRNVPNMQTICKLGYPELIDPEEVRIVRMK